MLISGIWRVDADGVRRPYLRCEVRSEGGNRQELFRPIDSGADRTILTSSAIQELGYQVSTETLSLSGLGGMSTMVEMDTALRLFLQDDSAIILNGTYAAAVSPTGWMPVFWAATC